jgi:hypothetical protein
MIEGIPEARSGAGPPTGGFEPLNGNEWAAFTTKPTVELYIPAADAGWAASKDVAVINIRTKALFIKLSKYANINQIYTR